MKGLILSSRVVGDELRALFGDIHPSNLPVGGTNLNELQYDYLKEFCDEVYTLVSENTGGCKNEILVGRLSLVELLKYSLRLFPNEFVLILYGDTLFQGKIPKNTSFVTMNKVDYLYNWLKLQDGYAFSGMLCVDSRNYQEYAEVDNLEDFITKTAKTKKDFISSLKWLDFGSYASYFKNKRILFQIRAHNEMRFNGSSLIKSSRDVFQLFAQFKWLKDFRKNDFVAVPRVDDFEVKRDCASYSIEYMPLPTLSELFVFSKGNQLIILKSFETIGKILGDWRNETLKTNKNFPLLKFQSRKTEIENILKNHRVSETEIQEILKEVLGISERWPLELCFGHGDFCFSNILFDNRSEFIYLIDPRGYFGEEYSNFVPVNYDAFKIAHSYLGHYDHIIFNTFNRNNFILEFEENLSFLEENLQLNRKDIVEGVMYLFVTLLPLHTDRRDRIDNFIYVIKFCKTWL